MYDVKKIMVDHVNEHYGVLENMKKIKDKLTEISVIPKDHNSDTDSLSDTISEKVKSRPISPGSPKKRKRKLGKNLPTKMATSP